MNDNKKAINVGLLVLLLLQAANSFGKDKMILKYLTTDGSREREVEQESVLQMVSIHYVPAGINQAYIIFRVSHLLNKKWTAWETLETIEVREQMNNEKIENFGLGMTEYAVEAIDQKGKPIIYVPVKKGKEKYWWEKGIYFIFLRRIYYPVKDSNLY